MAGLLPNPKSLTGSFPHLPVDPNPPHSPIHSVLGVGSSSSPFTQGVTSSPVSVTLTSNPLHYHNLPHHRSFKGSSSLFGAPAYRPSTSSSLHQHHHLHNTHMMDNHHPHDRDDRGWDQNRWETGTAITANTSPCTSINVDLNLVGKSDTLSSARPHDDRFNSCQMYSGSVVAAIVSGCAFLTPIFMIILPKINPNKWLVSDCGPECDGLLISVSFKLVMLLMGTWFLFARRPRANMPRVFLYRAIILGLIVLMVISYWLFFVVRAGERRFANFEIPYRDLLQSYPIPLVENLLWVHYLAVILIELRHHRTQYYIKVVRSPDGSSKSYTIGQLSIQRTAIWVLEKYYSDFPIYNPFLDGAAPASVRKRKTSTHASIIDGNNSSNNAPLKIYDVDGINGPQGNTSVGIGGGVIAPSSPRSAHFPNGGSNSIYSLRNSNHLNGGNKKNHSSSQSAIGIGTDRKRNHRSSGHNHRNQLNDRLHEEYEFERRVKKRRARLNVSADEAFTHIKLMGDDPGAVISMDPLETAQAIFPSMARPLQKYLRVTRQQPRHSLHSILDHLSVAMKYGMSSKSFLEKYLSPGPVLNDDREKKPIQSWGLVSDIILSKSIEDGVTFMLRQGDVSLLVTVSAMPYFDLQEEVIDPKSNRFVFRLNSETSV